MRRQSAHSAQLQVVHPPALVGRHRVAEAPIVIGRSPTDDGWQLADGTVSRKHARIRWDGERHLFADLGSRNGSRVGGAAVEPADAGGAEIPLEPDAVVRVGDVLMVYERGPAVNARDDARVDQEAICGHSAAAVRLRAAVAAAALDPSPILLIGETGTGKEFIAREIHRLSRRRGPFVAVNCAALSPQLVESQLFGHRRGAFTGADADHQGLFRAADGGTILLDEVGELPPELQAKLLRVLQEGEVLPVGDTRPIAVDCRVVGATLRDLRRLADEGTFRLDLYARLSPWEIRVPSMAARRADLLSWIARLDSAWHTRRHLPQPETQFEANAAERLLLHRWVDNLRGLDRLVHHVRAAAGRFDVPEDWLEPAAHPATTTPTTTAAPSVPAAKRTRRPRPSKEELERALARNGGSVRATAKELGRERRLLYRWMEMYGLREK